MRPAPDLRPLDRQCCSYRSRNTRTRLANTAGSMRGLAADWHLDVVNEEGRMFRVLRVVIGACLGAAPNALAQPAACPASPDTLQSVAHEFWAAYNRRDLAASIASSTTNCCLSVSRAFRPSAERMEDVRTIVAGNTDESLDPRKSASEERVVLSALRKVRSSPGRAGPGRRYPLHARGWRNGGEAHPVNQVASSASASVGRQ